MNQEEDKRLTVTQWRLAARMSIAALSREAGLSYNTVMTAEIVDRPMYSLTATKIISALQEHFRRFPEHLPAGHAAPEKPEDIKGMVVYESHNKKPRDSKQKDSIEQE